ncbi:MAG: hypothetical protein GYB35_08815 [Algicola sp.]|nr:hypothetical protein [Algicola sp.]
MTTKANQWNKLELQIYILILCANADKEETEVEIEMITSKVDPDAFDKIYNEFKADSEVKQFEKIDDNIQRYDYDNKELTEFKHEIQDVFFSNGKFMMMQQNLNRALDNILF